jgi:hypothetical protein
MNTLPRKAGALAALAVTLGWAAAAQAASPWTIFGDAQAQRIRGDWLVALTSDFSDDATDNDSAGVCLTPTKSMTFGDIRRLSADYLLATGGAGGGSPRFQITVQNSAGDTANVFVYLGTPSNFDDAASADWQSTGNLAGTTDLRVDTSQVGGTFYDDWAGALDLVGDAQVTEVCLVVDGGWAVEGGVQTVLVDDVRVNNFKLTGKNFKQE